MKQIDRSTLSVVSPELAGRMKDFNLRMAMQHAGYPDPATGYPPMAEDWGRFPQAKATRSKVYYGNETYAYNHHQTLARFADRFVVSWSSGFKHEDHPGQHVRYATSTDGLHWETDRVLVPPEPDSGTVLNNVGMVVVGSTLYALVGVCNTRGNRQLGMCSMEAERISLDVYATQDLERWERRGTVANGVYLFEGPRRTAEGRLMCAGCAINDWGQGIVVQWDEGSAPDSEPRIIKLPKAEPLEPIQCTWQQTADGSIYLFLRDGDFSCRLGLSFSEDGGSTWSKPLMTDFPNTCSRMYAGQLTDGQYYLAGNNYRRLLDRRTLLVAVSGDGTEYDSMYTIVTGSPTRRIEGKHKEDGYHYPNGLADGDNLLVTYSYNKEDIEVAIVDTRSLSRSNSAADPNRGSGFDERY